MPIKDRTRRRLVRLGIIRLGYMKENSRGTKYPAQADSFLLHDAPEIQEFYAAQGIDKVCELDVLLPFPDIDRNFSANYQVWAGGVLVCQGDGEYVSYATPFTTTVSAKKTSVKNAAGDTHVSDGCAQVAFDWNGDHFEPGELVPCSGATQDLYPHCKACRLSCLLKVMMADESLFRMGYYQIATSSGRNHDTILGTLEALPADRVNGISFKLRLVEGSTTYQDKNGKRAKGTRWFLQLEPDPTITRKLYKRATERMIEAPAPRIAASIDHGPEWSSEPADGNGALYYEAGPPAPPPFAEVAPEDIEEPEPESTYIRVPYPGGGLDGQRLLTHAVQVMSFDNVGECMTVLFTVHGNDWRDLSPMVQWRTLDDHCAAPVQAAMPMPAGAE